MQPSREIVAQQVQQDSVREHEYCLSHGQLNISRLVRNKGLNTLFNPSLQTESKTTKVGDRLTDIVSKGKVIFQSQSDDEAAVSPGHVEVQVTHSTLTKEGVRVVTGTDYPTTFSHELAGVVMKLGPGVAGLAVGDRVVGVHADSFSTHQEVPASLLQKLFEGEDVSEAVSLLVPYATALYGLQTLAGLQRGEHILILHSTGTSGAAAIKIAQALAWLGRAPARLSAPERLARRL